MPRFHLFSIRVERPLQSDLLDEHSDAIRDVIAKAIEEQPEIATAWDHEWHVGRVEKIPRDGIYLQLGRVTTTTEDQWDEGNRAFVETVGEKARWTPVIVAITDQVMGIVPNTTIGRKPASLGRKLRDLLNNTSYGKRGFRFFIGEILDPEDFVEQIVSAYAVSKFSFTVAKPNFPDSYTMSGALENWVQDLDGTEGKAEVKGNDLDRASIEEQARETISRGGRPIATLRRSEESKSKTIGVKDNPVTVEGEFGSNDEKRSAFHRILAKFREVRSHTIGSRE